MVLLPRPLILGLFLCIAASTQKPIAPISTDTKNAVTRDSAPVAAVQSKEQQKKQAEFDVRYAEAVASRRARDFQAALDKFLEAEQLTGNLTDTKYSWLQEVLAGEADCFIQLQKFEEAEKALLRRKDALKITTNELDPSYAQNFSLLADLSAKQLAWASAEAYLQQAMKARDKIIAHLADSGANAKLIELERRSRAFDLFHLGVTYAREAKYAEALSVLDDSFTAASEAHVPAQQLTPIASAAKDIAVHTGFPEDVKKWQGRITGLAGGSAASKN
jgi:tetratricopeptide (TPR) repeat protein